VFAGGDNYGVTVYDCPGAYSQITAALNDNYGITGNPLTGVIQNVATVFNYNHGIRASKIFSTTFVNIASGNNRGHAITFGKALNPPDSSRFTGVLLIGGNKGSTAEGKEKCEFDVGYGTTEPLSQSCGNQGLSDAHLVNTTDFSRAFVGRVTAKDAKNPVSGADGTANYVDIHGIAGWTSFENSFRGWSLDMPLTVPFKHAGDSCGDNGDEDHKNDLCRIYDWSLKYALDNPLLNALPDLPSPTVDDRVTHKWLQPGITEQECAGIYKGHWTGGQCVSMFFPQAVELPEMGNGNGNTLCECGESCLYTPNIGAYQGHGALIHFQDIQAHNCGQATKFFKYSVNGVGAPTSAPP